MNEQLLKVENLHAGIEGKEKLKGINLTVNRGEVHAIMGPNGSGKSNISDAVRWVLGETSTKSLRGSKMEDVIFGGTSARKARGFAQVQLTLDNSDGTLKDRGEIVTVTRR